MKIISGGITAPLGFKASGIYCGIKKAVFGLSTQPKDLGLIYSQVPTISAGAFTTNKIKAAPVRISQKHLRQKFSQAIIVNSGMANACTGKKGLADAFSMAEAVAGALRIQPNQVLVASTGVIGRLIPIQKVLNSVYRLAALLSKDKANNFVQAIMTTDKSPKQVAVQFTLAGKKVKIGAAAKGAGMINPHLATMLCFITTDCAITKPLLQEALRISLDSSFNTITVDGDMSTNDTVLILANGLAKNKPIYKKDADFNKFAVALNSVTSSLAEMMVKDGEGATKFIKVIVRKAKTKQAAQKIAKRIAHSTLVKTAIYGSDPNWGRVAAACGSAGVNFNADRLDIYLGPYKVLDQGQPVFSNNHKLKDVFKRKEVDITINLNNGRKEAVALTCDLTLDYIKINAHYRT